MDIKIINASVDQIDQLINISRKTFYETFSEMNSEDNMNKYLDHSFSKEKLTAELLNPDSTFYFATQNGNIIGYLKLNSANSQTELKDNKAIEIERIYVLKEFHGKSVGQHLYNKALEIAMNSKVEYLWLGVWENNYRAISFYKKNGFIEFDTHIFKLGDEEQTDFLMKKNLNQH